MNFSVFSLVTIVGSGIWCWVLAYLGDKAYRAEPELLSNPEAMVHFIKAQSHWILLFVLGFAALYVIAVRMMQRRN